MRAVYRVHTVITYLDGHPIRAKAIKDGGQYWKEREVNQTKWDIVVAPGVEEACALIRRHYHREGVVIKRIYSLNHVGDVTLEAPDSQLLVALKSARNRLFSHQSESAKRIVEQCDLAIAETEEQ